MVEKFGKRRGKICFSVFLPDFRAFFFVFFSLKKRAILICFGFVLSSLLESAFFVCFSFLFFCIFARFSSLLFFVFFCFFARDIRNGWMGGDEGYYGGQEIIEVAVIPRPPLD